MDDGSGKLTVWVVKDFKKELVEPAQHGYGVMFVVVDVVLVVVVVVKILDFYVLVLCVAVRKVLFPHT